MAALGQLILALGASVSWSVKWGQNYLPHSISAMTPLLIHRTTLTSLVEFWGWRGAGRVTPSSATLWMTHLTSEPHPARVGSYVPSLCPWAQNQREGSSHLPSWEPLQHSLVSACQGLLPLRPRPRAIKGRWCNGFKTKFTPTCNSPASRLAPPPAHWCSRH